MYKRNVARCICIQKNLAGKTAEALYDLAEIKTKIILWLFRGQTRVLGIVSAGYCQAGGSVTEEEKYITSHHFETKVYLRYSLQKQGQLPL